MSTSDPQEEQEIQNQAGGNIQDDNDDMFADSSLPVSSVAGSNNNNENVWQFGVVQGLPTGNGQQGLESEMKNTTNLQEQTSSEDIFGELTTSNTQKGVEIVAKIASSEATEKDDQSSKKYGDKEEHSTREYISAESLREQEEHQGSQEAEIKSDSSQNQQVKQGRQVEEEGETQGEQSAKENHKEKNIHPLQQENQQNVENEHDEEIIPQSIENTVNNSSNEKAKDTDNQLADQDPNQTEQFNGDADNNDDDDDFGDFHKNQKSVEENTTKLENSQTIVTNKSNNQAIEVEHHEGDDDFDDFGDFAVTTNEDQNKLQESNVGFEDKTNTYKESSEDKSANETFKGDNDTHEQAIGIEEVISQPPKKMEKKNYFYCCYCFKYQKLNLFVFFVG